MLETMFFLLGATIGSFLNVVIYRLPLGRSIIYPGSKCVKCEHILTWYELIPIISFLWQRGKCRYCGTAISPRYPLVELSTGLIFVWLFRHYGWEKLILVHLR